jgi:thiamine transporter
MSKSAERTKIITEAVSVMGLTFILKDILPPLYTLPQRGSITIAGMVPLLWFALRRGVKWGIFAGVVYGLVHMALGGFVIDPIQALLDYPLAFGALGLAGWFKKFPLAGVATGVFGRFVFHFISGVWFFGEYAVIGGPVVWSIIYNGSYLLGEFLISALIIDILVKRKLLEIYM